MFVRIMSWIFLISRKLDYSSKEKITLIDQLVEDAFKLQHDVLLKKFSSVDQENLYYISGWVLSAMKKTAHHRKKDTSNSMNNFIKSCLISSEDAKKSSMPTGKVDRVMAFGGLSFCSPNFFIFIVRI